MKSKFILTSIILIFIAMDLNAQSVTPVTSTDAAKLLTADKKWVVLDVRTPAEFNMGHIKGAINIDVNRSDAVVQYNKLNKNAKYLVICRTRNRSGVVVDYMAQQGFKTIYQITDGMAGWTANGLPVEK